VVYGAVEAASPKKFGASSEKSKRDDQEQLNLFNEAEAERQPIAVEPDVETISYQRKKGKRGENIKDLPVEVIEYTLPEGEQTCPACGEELHVMSKEVRKELTIVPAKVKVIEHVNYVYGCRNCEKNNIETPIITANAPKALLPKSMVSAELMAYIMSQKFVNAMPLYRQEQEFKRLGVTLSRQNLSNWVIKGVALLEPLLAALKKSCFQGICCTPMKLLWKCCVNPADRHRQIPICGYIERPGIRIIRLCSMTTRKGAAGNLPRRTLQGFPAIFRPMVGMAITR